MPFPLNYRVSDVFVRTIRFHMEITDLQANAIRDLLSNMPVRIIVDILSRMGTDAVDIINYDRTEADGMLLAYYTPYHDLYTVVLNEIRLTLGDYESWFPDQSSLRLSSLMTLTRMYEHEQNDGIAFRERQRLYQMIDDIEQECIGDPNDYNDAPGYDDGDIQTVHSYEISG